MGQCSTICKRTMSTSKAFLNIPLHVKARQLTYTGTDLKRFEVPDDKVPWSVDWPEYRPVDYTAEVVKKQPIWADPDVSREDTSAKVLFNKIDGKVNRRSHMGEYKIVNRVPRNPCGRTGMEGRGLLGKWGPNHAADPIVTRWKRDKYGNVIKDPDSGMPILQFVSIKRRDTNEWAIPGGMVDAGETVSFTLKREFGEEALNTLDASGEEREAVEQQVASLFKCGFEVYRGYVDDPRNTDNAWMETVAVNFHDMHGSSVGRFQLHAGDDAGEVQWAEISSQISLYASHQEFIRTVAARLKAHW